MPKLKTHKATLKRFKRTGTKKFIQRSCGQDHFNARDNGKASRAKKSDQIVFAGNVSHIKKSLPYA